MCSPCGAGRPCGPLVPTGPQLSFGPTPFPCGPASACVGGAYGPCTPPCNPCCSPCCTLNTPIPQPCCSPFQQTPCGPCPLEPPQMMVCYRRPCSSTPGKEEYQCFPAYFKLPETGTSPICKPQPFNPLPPCCQ